MKLFIEAGWHTVPLGGELKRLPDGSKTIPVFEKGWKKKYALEKNEKVSNIGGVITGKQSGILAIDCDNVDTYNLFKSLDPDYEAVFVSIGKGYDAGTFIYLYDKDIPTFSIADEQMKLDMYNDKGFVYLPTKHNKTKEFWPELKTIKKIPDSTKLVLLQLAKKIQIKSVENFAPASQTKACLNPLLTQFVGKRGEFMPSLFKVITPKDFRSEEQYQKFGYLHPNGITEGKGSEYLSKISAIFGADESVDQSLYMDAMICINNLFKRPMDADRFDKTICEPMLTGKASIDDKSIWVYNKHWADKRFTVTTKHGLIIDLCFDDKRNIYYYIDMTNEIIRGFGKDNDFISYLDVTVSSSMPKKPVLKKKLPIVHVMSDPAQSFGFVKSKIPQVLAFNSFKPSPELSILHNPKDYKMYYKEPVLTLRYLECLVPNKDNRDYLIQFIKRKLTKFEYSPVVLFFLGVPGSGKDTFVMLMEKIINKVARPTTGEFLEVHNQWLLDTYFVQLDEYGDQLYRLSDKEMVKGKLKAYTGKPTVQIRAMRQDSYEINHSITFIMTANKNPLMVDDQDRRIHLMETPNVLEMQPWFNADIYDRMVDEIQDFCYYLGHEVPLMSKDDYMTPPKSSDKRRLIADSMYAAHRIAYALEHQMLEYLRELALDYNAPGFAESIIHGRFTATDLESLYDEMTEFKGDSKTIKKIIRKKGLYPIATTVNGEAGSYYVLDIDPFKSGE